MISFSPLVPLKGKNVSAIAAFDENEGKFYLRLALNVACDLGLSASGKTLLVSQMAGELIIGSNLRTNVLLYKNPNVTGEQLISDLKAEFPTFEKDSSLIKIATTTTKTPEKGHGFFIRANPEQDLLFIDIPFDSLEKVSTLSADIDTVAPLSSSRKSRLLTSSGGNLALDGIRAMLSLNLFVDVNKPLSLQPIVDALGISKRYESPTPCVPEQKTNDKKKKNDMKKNALKRGRNSNENDIGVPQTPSDLTPSSEFVRNYLANNVTSVYTKEIVKILMSDLSDCDVKESGVLHAIIEYYVNHIRNEYYLHSVLVPALKEHVMPPLSVGPEVKKIIVDTIAEDVNEAFKAVCKSLPRTEKIDKE